MARRKRRPKTTKAGDHYRVLYLGDARWVPLIRHYPTRSAAYAEGQRVARERGCQVVLMRDKHLLLYGLPKVPDDS